MCRALPSLQSNITLVPALQPSCAMSRPPASALLLSHSPLPGPWTPCPLPSMTLLLPSPGDPRRHAFFLQQVLVSGQRAAPTPASANQSVSLVFARCQVPGDRLGTSSRPWGADGQAGTGSKVTEARTWLTDQLSGSRTTGQAPQKMPCVVPATWYPKKPPSPSKGYESLSSSLPGSPSVTCGPLCSHMCLKNLTFSCPMGAHVPWSSQERGKRTSFRF